MEKELQDKGWAAMRAMLDREMPQKRRRRFGWWWFLLLLLPATAYGVWRLRPAPALASPKPIATIVPPTPAETAIPLAAAESASAGLSAVAPATPTKPRYTPPASPKPVTPPAQRVSPNDNTTPEEHTTANIQSAILASAPQDPIETLPPFATVKQLPILSGGVDGAPSLLPVAPALRATITAETKPVSSQKTWRWGATAALSTERFASINGFSGGALVDWQFAKKWGLRGGLSYASRQSALEYREIATVQSSSYLDNVSEEDLIILDVVTGDPINALSPSSFSDSLGSSVLIPINRLNRLEMPLQVYWKPFRRWNIQLGSTLVYNFSTKADATNYSGDYLLKTATTDAAVEVSRLAAQKIDKWQAEALLGVGYSIGKHFEIGATCRLPLSNADLYSRKESYAQLGTLDSSNALTLAKKLPLFSLQAAYFF